MIQNQNTPGTRPSCEMTSNLLILPHYSQRGLRKRFDQAALVSVTRIPIRQPRFEAFVRAPPHVISDPQRGQSGNPDGLAGTASLVMMTSCSSSPL
jgi:hypothetical protein